jgi:glycosyltransferase involved in cell wall biosynthesis
VTSPELTIIIPSKNRTSQLQATLKNLSSLIPHDGSVEIIISDNSDIPLERLFESQVVRLIRPSERLDTAEENLLFALEHAKGKYIWPLGDDDVVVRSGLSRLLEFCKVDAYEAMVWNAKNVTGDYESMGWSRVMAYSPVVEISYSNFLERIGYWSIPAGISLTIFKREMITREAVTAVQNLRSKIYSHVTLYALLFRDKKFAFINEDLVEYRTNLYDLSHESTSHWTDYTSRHNHSDRFIWNLGFIEHLELLESAGAIGSNFLARAVDIGHFNHRLPLLEHCLSLFLDQLEMDFADLSVIRMTNTEVNTFIDYLERVEPTYIGIYQLVRRVMGVDVKGQQEKTNAIRRSKSILSTELEAYPYGRFYHSRVYGYFIFDTPLGWLALPQRASIMVRNIPKIEALEEMMLGIEFHKIEGIFHATSLVELLEIISGCKLDIESLKQFKTFQIIPQQFKENFENRDSASLLLKVWRKLPLKVKIYLKRQLQG